MVTHEPELGEKADRIIRIKDGRWSCEGWSELHLCYGLLIFRFIMKAPILILFIALIFSGCVEQIEQNAI